MVESLCAIIIIAGYVSAYFISIYSLAVYIDPDELELLYPGMSKGRRRLLEKLAADPRAFVLVALIYKSFVLITISFCAVYLLKELAISTGRGAPIYLVVMMVIWLVYIFAVEFLPRRTSRVAINLHLSRRLWLIATLYFVFSPILALYRHSLKRPVEGLSVSEEDKEEIVERAIETLADEAGIGESIVAEDEKEMIGQIFQLDQTVVREIMVPRIDITAIKQSMPFREIRSMIHKDGHSRYPVFDGSIDQIIGMIYVKDIFNGMPEPGEEFIISKYLRKPFFVPESKVIGELLSEFKARHLHIAIVVDEYGGVAGLVTLEDIIEEIFGEIQDEHDYEEEEFSKLSGGRYRVHGSFLLAKLQNLFDTDYEQGEYDTVGGMIYDLVGSVPNEGQKIDWNDIEFEIDRVEGQRILYVNVKFVAPTT